MKKSQFLIAALCASVLVLGACRSSRGEGDGSSSGSTSGAYGTSEAGTSQAGTSQGGTSQSGTSQAGTSQAGTSEGGVSGSTAGTSGTSGTSESGPKTDWSTEELQVIDYYIGVDIPYMSVEGAELYRDEANACLSYGGGEEANSSKELLREYASLFDESWNIRATRGLEQSEYGFMYFGSKTIGEGEDSYDISVSIYGYDEEGVTMDGSGVFYADFSDGYYYSWAEFAPTYYSVLDNIYGEYDEQGNVVPFPDVIDYPGDLFYIDVYNATDTALVFAMWGVDSEGFDSFIELFEASENWESYSNAIEGCPAYYDASQKVAIGYLDYTSAMNAAMIIVEPYEEILPTWPSTEISTFVASVNGETSVVVPALTAAAYVAEADEDGFFIYAFDDQLTALTVEEYATSFPAASWTVEEIEDPEIGSFWNMVSKDFAVNVQAAFLGEYAVVLILPSEPLEKEFSVEAVQTFYAGLSEPIAVPAFGAYTLADANGGFEVYASESSYDVYVLGSSTAELASFVSSFVGSTGWALDEDRTSEDAVVYADPDSLAILKVIDKSAEVGAHYIQLSFGLALDWSDELKAQFEEKLHGVVPPYFEGEVSYDTTQDVFYFAALDDEDNVTATFMNAYYAFSADSSWTADDSYAWHKEAEDGGVVYALLSTYDYNFYIYYEAAAEPGWSEDDLDFFDESLGGIVPAYFDGGYDEWMAYFGYVMSTNEFSAAEFAEYADASGWEEVAEPLEAVIYEKWAEDQSGVASFFLDMFGYIEFEYTQVAWKTSEIAAFESELHGIVPSFLRLGLYEIGGEEHAFVGMSLFETAEELVEALDEDLAEQAWVKSGSGAATVYTLASEDGEGYAQISVFYDDYYEGYSWAIDFVANAA